MDRLRKAARTSFFMLSLTGTLVVLIEAAMNLSRTSLCVSEGCKAVASQARYGNIGDHGAAILSKRKEIGLDTEILSDSTPRNGFAENILKASPNIHDPGIIVLPCCQQSGTGANV